jgi:hypothetical protein
MTANRKSEPTAAQAYAAHRGDIAQLLDVLQSDLDAHAADAAANPTDWSRTGDLGKVRSDLIDLVAFMSRRDRRDVEAALAD